VDETHRFESNFCDLIYLHENWDSVLVEEDNSVVVLPGQNVEGTNSALKNLLHAHSLSVNQGGISSRLG